MRDAHERRELLLLRDLRTTHDRMPRWVFLLGVGTFFAVFASLASSLLVTLAISALCAYLLNTPIKLADALGIRRSVAVSALFLCGFGVLCSLELLLEPYLRDEIVNFSVRLPELSRTVDDVVRRQFAESSRSASALERAVQKMLDQVALPGELINRTLNVPLLLDQAVPFLLGVVLVPFFVFFLLKDWPSFSRQIMKMIPPVYVERTISLLCEIDILVGRYLRGLALDCLAVAAIAAIGLWLLGVPYPITLGLLTGVANVVPYLGPLSAFLTVATITLVQSGSIRAVLPVLVLFAAIRVLDDLVVQPLTVGKSVELHPMLLVIAIIGGERLFGVIGMVVAVPLVTICQKTASILLEYRQICRTPGKYPPGADLTVIL